MVFVVAIASLAVLSVLLVAVLPGSSSRHGLARKLFAAACAVVVGLAATWAIWAAIGLALAPHGLVTMFGSLFTFGVIAAALYTWAIEGPIRWRTPRTPTA